jgi:L-lysine exporter family protein LysE/ArgO
VPATFEDVTTLLAGLGLGLSLIVAIGAQNLFVLRQGIRREHVFTVATICALSDLTLISLGVAGLGAATTALPWLVEVVRWAGAAFLICYGLLAARRTLRPPEIATDVPVTGPSTRLNVVATCLALTWLNPHVYLDTVFLLGSVAATHGDQRWWFALGAMLGSIGWFYGLGYGARLLSRWLTTEVGMRLLDGFVAVVMILLGISLVVSG